MSLAAWKTAVFGFMVTSALVIAACAAFYFSADRASALSDDISFKAQFADELRAEALRLGEFLVTASACYWAVAALYGRGNVLSVKWANYPLLTSFALTFLLSSNSFYWNINIYCDVVIAGQTGFSISNLTQCPSSGIAFHWLNILAILLALHSLLFRIVSSRKKENSGS